MTEETAIKNINEFIKSKEYNLTVEQIFESYTNYFKEGLYVSYTIEDSINHLLEELSFLYWNANQK